MLDHYFSNSTETACPKRENTITELFNYGIVNNDVV